MRTGNHFVEALELLARLGRRGGVFGLLLGVPLLAFSAYLLSLRLNVDPQTDVVFIAPYGFAVGGLFTLAGLFLVFGGGQLWRRDERFPRLPTPALLAALDSTRRPYAVCFDCRIVMPVEAALGRCPRCSSSASCFEVQTLQDVRTARSAFSDSTELVQ